MMANIGYAIWAVHAALLAPFCNLWQGCGFTARVRSDMALFIPDERSQVGVSFVESVRAGSCAG